MVGIPAVAPYPLPTAADLPGNVAQWVADPDRAVLLIHDMQRFFLRPFPDDIRQQLIRNTALLLEQCRALGVPVAYTMQPGGMTEEQRGLLKDFWGPGMRVDPVDRDVVAPLAPDSADWVFTKWRYSAFFRSDLLDRMRAHGRDQLIICGVYAHVGVLMSANDAFANGIQPFVVADAIADFSAEYHQLAVDYAAQRCAVVATARQVLDMTGQASLLDRILGPQPPPFALLHRPDRTGRDRLDVLVGSVSTPGSLAELPLPEDSVGPGQEVLVVVPYRQIAERGFACVDDETPLIAMRVTEQAVLPVSDVLGRISGSPIRLRNGRFDVDDEAYADTVRRVVADEIGKGEGSNFVIKRSYVGDVADYSVDSALTFFRRLCERESGAYWTFIVHTGTRTFVGATPERHVSLHDGLAVMNPISGTYRYPSTGPTVSGLLEFLGDGKESDELHMVVDEELKMMARICESGARVVGPYLKGMARLAHTEYLIEGRSTCDPQKILAETMFAPTVTGSPLESACRVISRYEPNGRGYYSGVIALIGRDHNETRSLDSAILIRTADIDRAGRMTIGVGATLVRHSDPVSEVAETRAKAAGLLSALEIDSSIPFSERSEVLTALERRNAGLAEFWLAGDTARGTPEPVLAGRRVLVVDAEDAFTAMIAHQLRSLGLEVTVRRFDEEYTWDGHELVVMGPGPGDPRDADHPRIAHLYSAIGALLAERRPFLAVCLSHQVLSRLLGLDVVHCDVSNQGTQREIDLFGDRELVGFYNTFAARTDQDRIDRVGIGRLEISRDAATGEVHALRGPRFASMQFHAESVLTQDGPRIFATRIKELLAQESPAGTDPIRADHRLLA